MADGDAPGNGTGGNATGGDGEEAAWLDLIARFDAPAVEDGDVPWPEREDLAGPVRVTPTHSPVENPAFDVTPARLVTALITERGTCAASRAGLLQLFPERR